MKKNKRRLTIVLAIFSTKKTSPKSVERAPKQIRREEMRNEQMKQWMAWLFILVGDQQDHDKWFV